MMDGTNSVELLVPTGMDAMRGEIFSADHLEDYAANLARSHAISSRRRGFPLLRRVAENGEALHVALRAIARNIQADRSISPAAEWLIDNFHVVDEQLREIRNHLPPSYYRDLPKLAEGELRGYPRVYAVICGYISHTDSRLDAVVLSRFVRAYQRVQTLTIGELWAVAITLRVALIENLRRLSDWVVGAKGARIQADKVADMLLGLRTPDQGSPETEKPDWKSFADSPYFSAFAVQLLQRLQDQAPEAAEPLEWLNAQLSRRKLSSQKIIRLEHQNQASLNVSVRNIITSMRLVLELDWKEFFETTSQAEAILRESPGYQEMDFSSRDLYRHAVEDMARGSRMSEIEIASLAVKTASEEESDSPSHDVGFALIGLGRPAFEKRIGYRPGFRDTLGRILRRHALWAYPVTILASTGLFAHAGVEALANTGMGLGSVILLGLLGAIPLSEGALALVNRFVLTLIPPRILPKLDFSKGIPAAYSTLLVIPALLRNVKDVQELLERLEVHYLANPDGDIRFALLSDWADAPEESMPGDAELLEAARQGIADLNTRYAMPPEQTGARFLLFHRKRLWNPQEGRWLGWERKRGKLAELNRLLLGARDVTFLLPEDDDDTVPRGIKYIITLDSDTRLPKGAAARMAGCLAHPLNRARFDAESKRVTSGYGILQPRVVPSLPEDGQHTLFHNVTTGPCGIDPYAGAVSDVYQDLFGEGSFSGKGIYDVQAFEASLHDRIPENSLLSHDLFEGTFARSGLLTDVEVLEEFPSNYEAFAVRQHRWARGDWQLLPWILGRRDLPALGRLKMLDNLRRTLLAPCSFLSLALGWLLSPQYSGAWTVLVLVALGLPYLVSASEAVAPPLAGIDKRRYLRDVGEGLLQAGAHYLLTIVLLAHQAWLMCDAIGRTLIRLYITRRRMLEWVTMAQATSQLRQGLSGFYRSMGAALLVSAPLGWVIVGLNGMRTFWMAAPLLVTWAASPALALLASTSRGLRPDQTLSEKERRALRAAALKTWRFFRDFVTKQENFLPPDNFQEDPNPVVAHRTSPTNMGLYLLSIATARDMGWLGLRESLDRMEAVLGSMGKLERYRGHFYNWYATQDLRPLEPKYVSTVDSGNLAGHLVAMKRACMEYMGAEILSPSLEEGLVDLIGLVKEAAAALSEDLRVLAFGRKHLIEALEALEATLLPMPGDACEWSARLSDWDLHTEAIVDLARSLAMEQKDAPFLELQARAEYLRDGLIGLSRDIQAFFPWVASGITVEALSDLPLPATQALLHGRLPLNALEERCLAAAAELRDLPQSEAGEEAGPTLSRERASLLAADLEKAAGTARRTMERFANIVDACAKYCLEMDFTFLVEPGRKLFAIGFRVREEVLDPSFYDLLASEARLTSFVAIAKGDVGPAHWFRLGRTLTPVGNGATLLSWSGSMFEYLMPRLVMRSPSGSLLDHACIYAVKRQIEYGSAHGIPWGVSEAAYNIRDVEMTYQYSSFGVPGLGLKRGLSEDLVIAPYATALAAMVMPREAAENLARLRAQGAEGRYGFYESIDYTRARVQGGKKASIIKSYFAHHQGMTLVALADVLLKGRMQERFHAEPMIRAVDPLLQERTPKGVTLTRPHADEVAKPLHVESAVPEVLHRFSTPHEPVPRTHVLSNGRYTVMVSAAGSGFSRWRGNAVTRWREDAVLDSFGQYLYLRDPESGEVWSAAYQPTGMEPDAYEAVFSEDRAEISRRDGSMATTLEIVVSPEDDAEVRRLTLENFSGEDREIEITSYAEVVIARPEADAAHPAFSNLFVSTEYASPMGALLANRRPRSATEPQIWAGHVSGLDGDAIGGIQYETDRARFLGRGHPARRPVSVVDGKPLSNTAGPVLDPVFSLRRRVRVPAGGRVRVVFATMAAGTREEVLAMADKYREPETFERVATLAWTQAQIQLRHLGIGSEESRLYQRLANRLFFPDPALRPSPDLLALNSRGQEGLWPFGISGDLPLIFASYDESGDRNLAKDLLKAHAYMEMKRLDVDLVLLNENPESYLQPQQAELEGLMRMRNAGQGESAFGTRGKVFLLRREQLTSEDRILLQAAARVVLVGRRGSLVDQVMRMRRLVKPPPSVPKRKPVESAPAVPPPRPHLEFFNGLGGFGSEGKEYHIILGEGQWTPAPWINVIANPKFGFITTEAGSGFTWCGNSRECKLTPWSNDPVTDPSGEAFYIRDRETGDFWSPTALPIRQEGFPYVAIHGQGYTRFQHTSHGIRSELVQWVPLEDSVKFSSLTLENLSGQSRHLDITFFLEWVIGGMRGMSSQHIQTLRDAGTGVLLARNPWNAEFSDQVAFADMDGRQTSWTCDRAEFLGRNGDYSRPQAIVRGDALSCRVGAGLDPGCALQTTVDIPPGGRIRILVSLGMAAGVDGAVELARRHRGLDCDKSLQTVRDYWDRLLGGIQIKTPDRSMDLLINRWLPYQTLVCRLWARSGFYQAGGAYGFRDQLQDTMALALIDPAFAREQILKASAHQFPEGDVQHWWHPPSGRGVRTHISDDRAWLAYAVLHYLDVTGDQGILDVTLPFLEGQAVPEGHEDAYFQPGVSKEIASVYEHCARALDRSLAVGAHGLPLMGSGDWNDGMNRVGHLGKGESSWLAWFLIPNLLGFSKVALARGESARHASWTEKAEEFRKALEAQAWDGEWYRRGYFDDGSPLGSATEPECRIDSIAQSWALLSGAGDPARARRAMFSAESYLVRRGEGLILLFTPPFDRSPHDPGYVKGYLPGVRENGGQYTHAAVWVVAAFAALGEGDKAAELFSLLNPINHAATRTGVYRYKVEPYVAAADVYAEHPHAGRGGWTWYTGSAGWMLRAGLEWILGFRIRENRLHMDPCIPKEWRRYEIRFRSGETEYEIVVLNPNGKNRGIGFCELDGVKLDPPPESLPLADDGKSHHLRIILD